ncbi:MULTISPECIES: hypothetical protein [unclassified Bradyrhizobium]|uniref:hypothetical protein n=1 Tax=unclassified Bradyrhizobium TaxID=2631580 RepID=UPI0028E93E23|nr:MULTISPECIES: hypothetical protein [unclassified Bradyrhizobium]
MTAETKVPVTMRALIARINRKLAHDYLAMRRCRSSSRWYYDLGDFYVVDNLHNNIEAVSIDPVEYGRELGVLQPFEEVAA